MTMDTSMNDWAIETSSVVSSCSTLNGDLKHPNYERPSRRNRIIVLVSLLLAALIFGLATYLVIAGAQHAEFEAGFESYARETADIAENNAENTFGQLRSFATAITSVAVDNDQKFPFVTIPHFDLRTQEIADLTGIEMIMFVPFVTQDTPQADWESYTLEHQDWILQDYDYRGWDPHALAPIPRHVYNYTLPADYNETRRGFVDTDNFMQEILSNLSYQVQGFNAPIAQYGPGLLNTSLAKLDLFSHPIFKKEIISSLEYDVPVISETEDLEFLLQHIVPMNGTINDTETIATHDYSLLRSFTLDQVKEDFRNNSRTIGYLVGVVPWTTFFRNLLPHNINGIVVKVVSDCGSNFTYVCNGGREDYALDGDFTNEYYKDMHQRYKFFWKDHHKGTSRHCHFDLVIFPNQDFADLYLTNTPIHYAWLVVGVILFTACVFIVYDFYQRSKQSEVIQDKVRAEAIVTSLFPKHVGEQLMAEHQFKHDATLNILGRKRINEEAHLNNSKSQCLSDFLSGEMKVGGRRVKTKPLADLFPSATISFADIVGFTAWSSVREPFQVFTLLETLYQAFDKISKKRKIFKVETIGDCYVAVAGLPKPRPDHAVAMAKFSQDCLEKFRDLVNMLEVELGPDTSDLGLRTGLHSGPVTAGVLRGERARFQLFGDTMNTCSRIESTGRGGRIHVSQECVDELTKFKKGSWVVARKDKVSAKGKGLLTTYWLRMRDDDDLTESESEEEDSSELRPVSAGQEQPQRRSTRSKNSKKGSGRFGKVPGGSLRSMSIESKASYDKINRLINWNTETLKRLLEKIVARRKSRGFLHTSLTMEEEQDINRDLRAGRMVFDEVQDIIMLPDYDQASADDVKVPDELSFEVVIQIREYVKAIAKLYPANAFHDFDHASHVCMSVVKMLSRVVAPKVVADSAASSELHRKIHDHTYGITSDPITQFACVFSSLIHDVLHPGVPNSQLVKEQVDIAVKYKNISVAEQNSVDVSWNILMEPRFDKLRAAIYATEDEMIRFRQLVVNSVMATDIVDKQLKALRNSRWERAFQNGAGVHPEDDTQIDGEDSHLQAINRKATIVIEHLIQASDVSHTMQHWHVFRKWNERLFREMYVAYQTGRAEKDPSEFWYKGEIGFFDFYIIPLAKKLKECGVFGVSSDEYLNYAQSNRREWEQKGEGIVKEYLASFHKEHDKYERAERRASKRISTIPAMVGRLSFLHPGGKKDGAKDSSSQLTAESLVSKELTKTEVAKAIINDQPTEETHSQSPSENSAPVAEPTTSQQADDGGKGKYDKDNSEQTLPHTNPKEVAKDHAVAAPEVTGSLPQPEEIAAVDADVWADEVTPSERDAGFTGVVDC